jgi:hypothetical protein
MNTAVLIVAGYLMLTLGVLNLAPRRVCMVWLAPWLALDCLASVVIRERFGATLSAKAWDARTHRWWGGMHSFIDGMPWFGEDHCRIQWEREKHYGGVWIAWAAEWRGEVFKLPTTITEG